MKSYCNWDLGLKMVEEFGLDCTDCCGNNLSDFGKQSISAWHCEAYNLMNCDACCYAVCLICLAGQGISLICLIQEVDPYKGTGNSCKAGSCFEASGILKAALSKAWLLKDEAEDGTYTWEQ